MSAPFRNPCGDSDGKKYKTCCDQPASDLHDRYVRTTQVPNWNTAEGQPATIDAYERWTPDDSGGDSCEVHHCVDGGAPCSQWPTPFIANTWSHTPGDQVNFAVTAKHGFKNVQAFRYWSGRFGFKHIEDGVDTTQCCGDGSIKSWRGYQSAVAGTKYLNISISAEDKETQYHYDGSGDPTGSTVNWDDTASSTQSIDPNSGLLTPSLTVTPDSDLNRAFANSLFSIGLWTWADIVNHMTTPARSAFGDGNTACTDTSITVTGGIAVDGVVPTIEIIEWDLSAGTFTRTLYEYSGTGAQFIDEIETVTVSDSSLAYSLTANTWSSFGGPDLQMGTQEVITVTATLSGANTSASIYLDVKTLLAYWPLNDDALYPWRIDEKVSVAPLVSRSEVQTTAFATNTVKDYAHPITDSLGRNLGDVGWSDHTGVLIRPDPNTGTDLVALGGSATTGDTFSGAVTSSLGFTTITGYAYTGLLPAGCGFDTTTGMITGTCSADCTWGITVTITGAAARVDGSVQGAPLPAGYQDSFNFNHQDWNGCCFTDPSDPSHITWSWYQVGWGMDVGTFNSNAGCNLPRNATQWTNYFQAVNKPQGAFLFYNDQCVSYYGAGCHSSDPGAISGVMDGDALWGCKYAEILEPWNSQNFALPAGDVKFFYDETRVYCVTNVSGSGAGSTWIVTNPADGTSPADGTDFSGIWGGPSVGGFYSVSSYAGGVVTLGSQVYDVPSNWASKSNGDDAQCFGKLRFPDAPSILGRASGIPIGSGTFPFVFDAPQPAFGMNTSTHQEQVDLWDANMTLVAGNVTATRSDDSTFTLPSGIYTTVRYVTITAAPAWYINDTAPKGDYTVLEWLADFRTPGEYARLTGVTDCSSAQVTQPTLPPVFTQSNGCNVSFSSFSQQQCCLPFVPCAPKVVCISPNGETFPNGTTYPFPETFDCDELYGSKWWGSVQSTMTDLFWQQPHRPCNIEPCAVWQMDDLTCEADKALDCPVYCCPGDDGYTSDSVPPVYYFGQPPQVEARLTVPHAGDCSSQHGYGSAQDENAPDLPEGIQIGWLSPVDNSTGDVALPPEPPGAENANGRPAGATTAWNIHSAICAATGCRFGYKAPGC